MQKSFQKCLLMCFLFINNNKDCLNKNVGTCCLGHVWV